MTLSEKSRTAFYTNLEPLLGEEAVGEMLSHFPAREVEEPATEEFVRAEIATVRVEIATVRVEIEGVKALIEATARAQTRWLVGSVLAAAGMLAAVDVFA